MNMVSQFMYQIILPTSMHACTYVRTRTHGQNPQQIKKPCHVYVHEVGELSTPREIGRMWMRKENGGAHKAQQSIEFQLIGSTLQLVGPRPLYTCNMDSPEMDKDQTPFVPLLLPQWVLTTQLVVFNLIMRLLWIFGYEFCFYVLCCFYLFIYKDLKN